MPTLFTTCRLLLFLLLLASCRSEKVSFQFRPAQPLTVRVDTMQYSGLEAVSTTTAKAIQDAVPPSGPAKHKHRKAAQVYPVNKRLAHSLLPFRTGSSSISTANFQPRRLPVVDKHGQPLAKNRININHLLAYVGLSLYAVGIIVGVIIGGSTGFTVGAIIFGIGVLLFGLGFGGVERWPK